MATVAVSGDRAMKICAFIQARMGSSRFPGKVLAPLAGRPVIEHVFEFAKSLRVDHVFLLTSDLQENDVLVEWANNNGLSLICRGDDRNVASRFNGALLKWPCDYTLRICGDSPFLDWELATRLINEIHLYPADYYGYETDFGMPGILTTYGLFIEGFRTRAFFRGYKEDLSDEQKEHVTNIFYQNPDQYKCRYLDIPFEITRHPFRSSIDTLEDLRRADLLMAILEKEGKPGYWDIAHAVANDKRLQIEDAAQHYDW